MFVQLIKILKINFLVTIAFILFGFGLNTRQILAVCPLNSEISGITTVNVSSTDNFFDCSGTDTIRLTNTGSIVINRDVGYTGVVEFVFNNLIMDVGSSINADRQGYLGSTSISEAGGGLGGGLYCGNGSSGGSYGGAGGIGHGATECTSYIYGTVPQPNSLGSGGGSSGGSGGAGGGALKITINEDLTNNGRITVNGGYATNNNGSGSGGSIWIEVVGLLSGSGTISANGGNNGDNDGGAGGGGRITIVHQGSYNYSGTIQASGGTCSNTFRNGESGTLVIINQLTQTLTINTTQRWLASDVSTFETWFPNIDHVEVLQGTLVLDTINRQQDIGGFGWNLILSSLTIGESGSISLDGLGYKGGDVNHPHGYGPGKGEGDSVYGAGGSYGGYGGNGSNLLRRGNVYGLVSGPVDLGSGGGRNGGGNGGGAIKITTTNDFTLNGVLTADGEAKGDNRGSGSGGSIWIVNSGSFQGGGSVTANGGGNTDPDGGGGGGGRVFIEYSSSFDFSGTVVADKGTNTSSSSRSGENGTVVFKDYASQSIYIYQTQKWIPTTVDSFETWFPDIEHLYIASGTLLLDSANKNQVSGGIGWDIKLTSLEVSQGAMISADGLGYNGGDSVQSNGYGPGGGSGPVYGAGGSHGGLGGVSQGSNQPGSTYDLEKQPTDLGSGGGKNGGSSGGGAIKIEVTNSLMINGEISADGSIAGNNNGSGAGGSVWVVVHGSITGNGNLTAIGGNNTDTDGGAGGGGLVVLAYKDRSGYSGSLVANGGTNTINSNRNGSIGRTSYVGLPYFPNNALYQLTNDGQNTSLSVGGTIYQDEIKLRSLVKDVSSIDTLELQIELVPVGAGFSNSYTHRQVGIGWTLASAPATGEEVDIAITEGLDDNTSYQWQARVCDDIYCSLWSDFGNNFSNADFVVNLNHNPNTPTFVEDRITLVNFTNSTAPSFQFNLTDPNDSEQMSFQIQIATDVSFSNLVIDYTSTFANEGQRSYTVGQTGTYSTGAVDTRLTDDRYYWRIKAFDDSGTSSGFASPSTPYFTLDTQSPDNATDISMTKNINGHMLVLDGQRKWTNDLAPVFSWTASSDTGTDASGIKGYCLYLGQNTEGDPSADSGLLGTDDDSGLRNYNNCQFLTTDTSIDFATLSYRGDTWLTSTASPYYFKISAVDNSDNVVGQALSFTFYFDNTAPINVTSISAAGGSFSSVDDMYFSWPTYGSNIGATDGQSSILGYQYSLNDQTSFKGNTTHDTLGITYIPVSTEGAFFLSSNRDGTLPVGTNIIYFRTVDKSGNFSPASTYRTASISYGGDAPTFAGNATLAVTPTTNSQNSFSLEWDEATPSSSESIVKYYYMINTTPPQTVTTLTNNSSTYHLLTTTSVGATSLPNVHRGSNTVYVVAVADDTLYSPSNYLRANFTLDGEDPDPPTNLVVSDASVKSASLWRASLAWEEPDYIGAGSLTFTIQRSTDGSSWTTVATTAGYAYVDTVPSSTQYYWRVGSSDNADSSIASPSYTNGVTLTPKGSYTSAASLTSGPSASSITTKRATISWTTGRTSDSRVAFGTSSGSYFDEEPSNSSHVTDHIIKLNNLSPGLTYYYVTKWTDEDGNTGSSTEQTFTTNSAPILKDIQVKYVGINSAIVEYTVTGATSTKIYYGTSTSFGGLKEISTSTIESTYTVELSGLTDGTKYYYRINALDTEGDEYESTVILDFSTMPRPKITDVTVEQVDNSAQPTLVISWQSNTAVSSIVSFYPDGKLDLLRDEVDISLVEGEHQVVLRGLIPSARYVLLVKGRDKMGNEAVSQPINFTTEVDTRPPKISDLKIEGSKLSRYSDNGSSQYQVQLIVSWNTDEPATSQVEYGEGTGVSYAQISQENEGKAFNHVVVISGLSPAKVYHLRAISKDINGNISRSIDKVKITPNIGSNPLNLVIDSLKQVFGFLDKMSI
jgi:hypothetical protein